MNQYKVRFYDDYSGATHIIITKLVGMRQYVAKEIKLEFEEIPEGSFFKEPTLRIDWYDSKDFMAALKEALDGEKLPPSAVEGELKATKYHLEDMRKILDGFVGPLTEESK